MTNLKRQRELRYNLSPMELGWAHQNPNGLGQVNVLHYVTGEARVGYPQSGSEHDCIWANCDKAPVIFQLQSALVGVPQALVSLQKGESFLQDGEPIMWGCRP